MNKPVFSSNDVPWSPSIINALNEQFKDASPRTILNWAYETFGRDVVMATGFGTSGIVLMHLASQLRVKPTIFYLDTDLFFPETYALKDRLSQEFGISFTRVHSGLSVEEQSKQYGPELWKKDPDKCCFIRKVRPLQQFLKGKGAWITGLRAHQSDTRASAKVIQWDATHKLVKINPLVRWTSEEVWSYIKINELPYNELHDRGYPSIGCMPCTRPVAPGEEERSGRWAGRSKSECGIHVQSEAA